MKHENDLERAQRRHRQAQEAIAEGRPTLKVTLGELVGALPAPKSTRFGGEPEQAIAEPSEQEPDT
jgi:hypothetical protein